MQEWHDLTASEVMLKLSWMQLAATDDIRENCACYTLKALPLLCTETLIRLGLFFEKLYYGNCQLYIFIRSHHWSVSRYSGWWMTLWGVNE